LQKFSFILFIRYIYKLEFEFGAFDLFCGQSKCSFMQIYFWSYRIIFR